jgi:Chitin binding Peritrophin-A domain
MGSRDCSVYYLCFRDELLALRCGPEQHFDVVNGWCTTPESANCQVGRTQFWTQSSWSTCCILAGQPSAALTESTKHAGLRLHWISASCSRSAPRILLLLVRLRQRGVAHLLVRSRNDFRYCESSMYAPRERHLHSRCWGQILTLIDAFCDSLLNSN